MLVIGDVHGKVNQYYKLINKHKPNESIQLGDFGFKKKHDWFLKEMDITKHKIMFGNHDYYPYLDKEHSLKDFSFNPQYNLMTIRGAFSVDRVSRTEGLDWFANEEISYGDWYPIMDEYELRKPEIVISHDCPQYMRHLLFGIDQKSITTSGLQSLFELHQPKLWIFGHHHTHIDEVYNGTRFICLKELGIFNI